MIEEYFYVSMFLFRDLDRFGVGRVLGRPPWK